MTRRSKVLAEPASAPRRPAAKTGESFSGILFALDDRAWVLQNVEALGVGEANSNVRVDGEMIVLVADVADVAYVQVP